MLKSIIYIICKKRQILSCCRGYVICCQDMLSVLYCQKYAIGDILLGETLFYRYM